MKKILTTLGWIMGARVHYDLLILLYTARSQHAEIENSHSQRGKSEQALLKSYCKVLALPAHEFRVEVRVFN